MVINFGGTDKNPGGDYPYQYVAAICTRDLKGGQIHPTQLRGGWILTLVSGVGFLRLSRFSCKTDNFRNSYLFLGVSEVSSGFSNFFKILKFCLNISEILQGLNEFRVVGF